MIKRINVEIDTKDKIIFLSEDDSSGVAYHAESIDDVKNGFSRYVDLYCQEVYDE